MKLYEALADWPSPSPAMMVNVTIGAANDPEVWEPFFSRTKNSSNTPPV